MRSVKEEEEDVGRGIGISGQSGLAQLYTLDHSGHRMATRKHILANTQNNGKVSIRISISTNWNGLQVGAFEYRNSYSPSQ